MMPETRLPLTRRALAAFTRWRKATDREAVARWCGLAEGEVAALERLDANLGAIGDWRGWLAPGWTMRAGFAHRLLAGLDVPADLRPALARALGPATWAEKIALGKALEAPPEPRMPARVRERPRRHAMEEHSFAVTTETLPPPVTPERGPTMRAQIEAAITARGLDLAGPVPDTVRREIAAEVGSTNGSVGAVIGKLRKARGLTSPTRWDAVSTNGAQHATPDAAFPREALLALAEPAMEHGLISLPEPFREPVRRLVRIALGVEEPA